MNNPVVCSLKPPSLVRVRPEFISPARLVTPPTPYGIPAPQRIQPQNQRNKSQDEAQTPVAKLQTSVFLFLVPKTRILVERIYFHLEYDNCHKMDCFMPF